MLTITDLFCGAGGSSSGAEQVPGVTVRMAANHWSLAIETHNTNLPHADHDCFPAGTPVLTSLGLRPIEAVEPGDLVLTHRGRWRPVVRKYRQIDDTVLVKTTLHASGIEVTANHDFWTRRTTLRVNGSDYARQYTEPAWQAIGDALIDRRRRAGHSRDLVALPRTFGELAWQDPPAALGDDPEAAWWLVGRWLGDGSSSVRNHDVTIVCGKHEKDDLGARVPAGWRDRETATTHQFYDYDIKLATWLTENFGHGAADKAIPGWVLTMPKARQYALLEGYLSADGSNRHGLTRASSVSRDLALSVRFLAHSLGHVASLHHARRGGECTVQGRRVNRLDVWTIQWPDLPTRSATYDDELHRWAYVQSIEPARSQIEVFTMEVAEDHSYVADGLVVKNCADVSQVDPRRYPRTDILWASPECTNHSQARGRKRGVDSTPDLFGQTLPDEASQRSRATMWDVVRFAEHHRYRAVLVENVVDAYHWAPFRAWLMAMDCLGYDHQLVWLNSMHAQAMGLPAPQSRDRMYVVFWRKGDRAPDIRRWTSPQAWCPSCDQMVRAVQTFKRHDRPAWGRYRQQYLYRCPTQRCHAVVEPGWLPAASAIDWTLQGERIGDRLKPLAPKTRARIEAGLHKYARDPFLTVHRHEYRTVTIRRPSPTLTAQGNHLGLLVPVEGRDGKQAVSTGGPMRTQTARNETGVAMLVPAGGTWNDDARSIEEPMRTRTTRDTEALVVPLRTHGTANSVSEPLKTCVAGNVGQSLVVPLRNHNTAKPVSEPVDTVAAAGNHHALVMRNNTARGNPAQMCTPVDEELRTITTTGHQSLIRWDHLVVDYNGPARQVSDPLPTQTTVEGDGVLAPAVDVDDGYFRMLEPHEIKVAMAFDPSYVLLGNKREQVRLSGNAVTPPAARDLIAAVAEALNGAAV